MPHFPNSLGTGEKKYTRARNKKNDAKNENVWKFDVKTRLLENRETFHLWDNAKTPESIVKVSSHHTGAVLTHMGGGFN